MKSTSMSLLVGAILACSATAFAGIQENGVKVNGVKLNGPGENGVRLNGIGENGVKLNTPGENGVRLNGAAPLETGLRLQRVKAVHGRLVY